MCALFEYSQAAALHSCSEFVPENIVDNPAAARLTDEVPVSLITWKKKLAQCRIIKMCERECDAVMALAG